VRVTFVQYAGDYREAFERLISGGRETYQAQRYSVNFVGSLPHDVTVVCAVSDETYDVRLPNGVRAIGAGLKHGFRARELIQYLAGTDRLILRSPMEPLLKWARINEVRTICLIADSFQSSGFKQKLKNWLSARHLDHAEWLGNHQLPACKSLQSIGIDPAKIIPWDWPPSHTPYEHSSRKLRSGEVFNLLYVGSVCEAKGVSDLIRAIAGQDRIHLTVVGPLLEPMPQASNVQFAGLIPNDEVPSAMREADAVVIPSRHEYPEGLPLVIFEALATRTPIIASDHPMFIEPLKDAALIFSAGDRRALLAAVQKLAFDPSLYARLSCACLPAWERLQIPVTFGDLIERWLADDARWLRANSLGMGGVEAGEGGREGRAEVIAAE
jgi:glycosyltransferase involved in cell wall biosynthesis